MSIPEYKYGFRDRLTAAKYSQGSAGEAVIAVQKDIMEAFGLKQPSEIYELKASEMPESVAKWLHENFTVIHALVEADK